jgi:hypothetical protein
LPQIRTAYYDELSGSEGSYEASDNGFEEEASAWDRPEDDGEDRSANDGSESGDDDASERLSADSEVVEMDRRHVLESSLDSATFDEDSEDKAGSGRSVKVLQMLNLIVKARRSSSATILSTA